MIYREIPTMRGKWELEDNGDDFNLLFMKDIMGKRLILSFSDQIHVYSVDKNLDGYFFTHLGDCPRDSEVFEDYGDLHIGNCVFPDIEAHYLGIEMPTASTLGGLHFKALRIVDFSKNNKHLYPYYGEFIELSPPLEIIVDGNITSSQIKATKIGNSFRCGIHYGGKWHYSILNSDSNSFRCIFDGDELEIQEK
jgi:hypothetical protein